MRSSTTQYLFNFFILLGLGGLYGLYFSHRPPKLAYVESAKVLDSYKEMQAARLRYQQQVSAWQANLDSLKVTVQGEVDAYNQVRTQLSPAQRQVREDRLVQRQQQYYGYRKAIKQQSATEEARVTEEVVRKADKLMKQYGREQGYDLVLAATEAGTVVYGREGADLTSEVIKFINK